MVQRIPHIHIFCIENQFGLCLGWEVVGTIIIKEQHDPCDIVDK